MQEEMFGDEKPKERGAKIVKLGKCSSGKTFENVVRALLESNYWDVDPQYPCGYRIGTKRKYVVDFHASKDARDILVSCKYQDVSGSAPDKLPYEYMCLLHAVNTCEIDKAYMVLEGEVLLRANMFKDPHQYELERYMTLSSKIVVCSFQEFSRKANRGEL